MKPFKFAIISDVHLGKPQYGLTEREDDFTRTWAETCGLISMQYRPDFTIITGDLFDQAVRDNMSPSVLRAAEVGLKDVSPVFMIAGNHDNASYRNVHSWYEYLHGGEVGAIYIPPGGHAFLDHRKDIKIWGMHWSGPATTKIFMETVQSISGHDDQFNILVAHAGVDGILPGSNGVITTEALTYAKGKVDILALGHIHKPYVIDNWIVNPGSLETCSIKELEWPERGFAIVDVDESGRKEISVISTQSLRREFTEISIDVGNWTPLQKIKCEGQVLVITLTGTLTDDVSIWGIREWARKFDPLTVRIRNQTEVAKVVSVELVVDDLEAQAFRQLLDDEAEVEQAIETKQRALDSREVVSLYD